MHFANIFDHNYRLITQRISNLGVPNFFYMKLLSILIKWMCIHTLMYCSLLMVLLWKKCEFGKMNFPSFVIPLRKSHIYLSSIKNNTCRCLKLCIQQSNHWILIHMKNYHCSSFFRHIFSVTESQKNSNGITKRCDSVTFA